MVCEHKGEEDREEGRKPQRYTKNTKGKKVGKREENHKGSPV
jgi:hypothetical protein